MDSEEKLKWASKRTTTKPEDEAYCLQGLLGVTVTPMYGEGKERAIQRLEQEIATAAYTVSQKRAFGSKGSPWIVPFERNLSFSGREEVLRQVWSMLFVGDYTSRVAITGLGGVGKTQIILELLHRRRPELKYCSVIWIPAASRESLEQGFLNAAKRLGIPGCESKDADARTLLFEHLTGDEAGQWLLIFDNADDTKMWMETNPQSESKQLVDQLPTSPRGSIVFTSRDKQLAIKLVGNKIVKVDEMTEADSLELLEKLLIDRTLVHTQREDAATLVARLTCLPLAIAQAASYINSNEITLSVYMALMQKQEQVEIQLLSQEFEDRGRYRETANPIAMTWLISFQRIQESDKIAAEYLFFMACVDSKDIPLSMLPPRSELEHIQAMGTLRSYDFVTMQVGNEAVSLHRLVHLAMRNWLRKEGLMVAWVDQAYTRLADLLRDADQEGAVLWRVYLPHASFLLDSHGKDTGYKLFADNHGGMSGPDGSKREREALDEPKAGEGDGRQVEDEYPVAFSLLYSFSHCLHLDGRYLESGAAFGRLLSLQRMRYARDHAHIQKTLEALAEVYLSQGRWKEAEQIQVQQFEVRNRTLGEDHLDTLTTMENLSWTYRLQSRLGEAEKLQIKVLESRKEKLGERDVETLNIMHDLALTYGEQGRLDEAEQLFSQTLQLRQEVLGKDHLRTSDTRSELAIVYWRHNRQLGEAESLLLQALEARKKTLGVRHPHTLATMSNLASIYRQQNRLDEAKDIEVEVLEQSRELQGPNHPDTLTYMNNLAVTLHHLGRRQEALDLMQDCLDRTQRTLGAEHAETRIPRKHLKEWRLEEES